MTDEERKTFTRSLIAAHAQSVPSLSIFDHAAMVLPSGRISNSDAEEVRRLLDRAKVTVEITFT